MKPETTTLRIADIRTDGGTQPRAGMKEETIAEYEEHLRSGGELPPPTVFHDGETYWLADGFHRLHAALRAGRGEIECKVRQGTRRDAVLYSVGANATHGLPRTAADKRRAVQTLLDDPEWAAWSNREIARRCRVSYGLVNSVRAESTDHGGQLASLRKGADGRTRDISAIGKGPRPGPTAFRPVDEPADVDRRDDNIPEGVEAEVTEVGGGYDPALELDGTFAEGTDEEYLESLPARPHLSDACRKRFDREALFYRALTPNRLRFERSVKPMCNDLKRAGTGHIGPFLSRLYRWFRTEDPSRWVACKNCDGTGQIPLIGNCPDCRGDGYRVF